MCVCMCANEMCDKATEGVLPGIKNRLLHFEAAADQKDNTVLFVVQRERRSPSSNPARLLCLFLPLPLALNCHASPTDPQLTFACSHRRCFREPAGGGGGTISVSPHCERVSLPRLPCTLSPLWLFYSPSHPTPPHPPCLFFCVSCTITSIRFRPCDCFLIKVPPLTQWPWQPTAEAPRLPVPCS